MLRRPREPRNPPPEEPPQVHARETSPLPAALVSTALGEYGGLFGPPPPALGPAEPTPIYRLVEWPWVRPLAVILRVSGFTIHDVVSDPRAAWEVRRLWRIWKAHERTVEERERRNAAREVFWWRHQGCPVPCPVCGTDAGCDCSVRNAG